MKMPLTYSSGLRCASLWSDELFFAFSVIGGFGDDSAEEVALRSAVLVVGVRTLVAMRPILDVSMARI